MAFNKKNNKQSKVARASRQYIEPENIHWGKEFEYKMPIAEYEDLLKECGKNKGGDAQTYLCEYVNDQLGLLGACVRVIPG